LPLARVLHVGALGPMLRLPHVSALLCGAVAHQGEVVPVFDLARLLGAEDPDAAHVAFVRHAGQTIGLRLAAIEGVGRIAGTDTTVLDLEALDLPAPQRLPLMSNAPQRRSASPPPSKPKRGLLVTIANEPYWLPLDQVEEVLDAAAPVPVPWADPRVPEILMRAGEAIAVVRPDLLLRASPTPTSHATPVVICRLGQRPIAMRVDSAAGLAERGATPTLDLQRLTGSLPGIRQAAAPPPSPTPPSESTAHLAFLLSDQPCLLPLRSVRSVAAHVRPAALPGAPPHLIGVRAMGGQIRPVVDPRHLLSLPTEEPLTVDLEVLPPDGPAFVLAAQQLDGIVRLPKGAIQPTALQSAGGAAVSGVARLGERLAWKLIPAALAPNARVDA
jgi:purine-binding chemotaxis protein CheW